MGRFFATPPVFNSFVSLNRLVSRYLDTVEVRSSSLLVPTICFKYIRQFPWKCLRLFVANASNFLPPLHIHHYEEESLYLLEGVLAITLGEKTMDATTDAFVQIPRVLVHKFHHAGTTTARLLLFFSPAGMENYFEKVLERVQDRRHSTSYRRIDCPYAGADRNMD